MSEVNILISGNPIGVLEHLIEKTREEAQLIDIATTQRDARYHQGRRSAFVYAAEMLDAGIRSQHIGGNVITRPLFQIIADIEDMKKTIK